MVENDKLHIFDVCVVSKLLYSLECECLLSLDRQRLNGFYAQCLRSIQKIPHSMFSHVSNEEVLRRASRQPLSSTLHARQLTLFGQIAVLPETSLVRCAVFMPGTVVPIQSAGKRKQGRPRTTWTQSTYALALAACGHDVDALHGRLCGPTANIAAWKSLVRI